MAECLDQMQRPVANLEPKQQVAARGKHPAELREDLRTPHIAESADAWSLVDATSQTGSHLDGSTPDARLGASTRPAPAKGWNDVTEAGGGDSSGGSRHDGGTDRSPSLGRASGQMAIATVVSRVTALGARLLLGTALGFAVLNDAYNVANTLPN